MLASSRRDLRPELMDLQAAPQRATAAADKSRSSQTTATMEASGSTSPTTSVSSKTAAFFGSNGSTIRPASLSVSSGSASAAPGSIFRETPSSATKEQTAADTSLWASGLSRFNSLQSSLHRPHRWDNFEGKPVTPLPSPGIPDVQDKMLSGAGDGNIFDADFDQSQGNTSFDSVSDRLERPSSIRFMSNEPISSLPSLTSLSTSQLRGTSGSSSAQSSRAAIAPKTRSFFDESPVVVPSSKSIPGDTSVSGEMSWSSPCSSPSASTSTRRMPSNATRLYEPSRLPSATAEFGGFYVNLPFQSTSAVATPKIGTTASKEQEGWSSSTSTTSQLMPTAVISPPSPATTGDQSLDHQSHATAIDSSPPPSTLSALSVSSPGKKAQSPGRHVHGPSENATNSSFLPALRIQQEGEGSALEPALEALAAPPADESEDESTGRMGKYQIEKTLGVGAFSRVALASVRRRSSTRNGSQGAPGLVALKMLEKEPCRQNERMRVSWVREVEVLKHIVHPSIVLFLSSFSTAKHHTLVLEQVGGGELFDLISNHHDKLVQREWLVRTLFGELANAVGWMHSINLVHRDIKLENIILTHQLFSVDNLRPSVLPRSPLLKISDFGLSRFIDPSSPLLETRCGSEEYAAPELIIGKRYDGRKTDVWALGVVLYALLSGSLPFLAISESAEGGNDQAARAYSRERGTAENGALARKAHLLRIAKGDLRWPAHTNDEALDTVEPPCPLGHRLITPLARRIVARLIRRDATKRATAWESWDEEWLTAGSLRYESSAGGETVDAPLDPRSTSGQAWLNSHARVHNGAADLTHDD